MLSDAPVIEEVLPKFQKYIGDSILVGHNVNFDINFLYDEFERILNKKLSNEYIDTMRIARKIYPELEHHRLSDIAEKCKIDTLGAHRALIDCEVTNRVFMQMKEEVLRKYQDINEFSIIKKNHYYDQKAKAKNILANTTEFDENHPLFGKKCVITGALEKMTRQEAMQNIANYGGVNEDNVTKKTNYLILGNNDYNRTKQKGKSTKYLKAEQYKLDKCEIEMIPEQYFMI